MRFGNLWQVFIKILKKYSKIWQTDASVLGDVKKMSAIMNTELLVLN